MDARIGSHDVVAIFAIIANVLNRLGVPMNSTILIKAFMLPPRIWQAFRFAALSLLLASASIHAAPGDADPLFGGTGYVRYAATKAVPGLFSAGVGLDDGSVIVAGGADSDVFVRHYRGDATLDEGYGNLGTTIVPGMRGGDRNPPQLNVFRDATGRILVEQAGLIRRLAVDGSLDAGYNPVQLNVKGYMSYQSSYAWMPQTDGRFVVVTGQDAGYQATDRISVRFYLPDGKPDTVRGDVNGERLVYPAGMGTYYPTSAVTDVEGKILIAARWERTPNDSGLVLIRLNQDGSYDAGFGQNGTLILGTQMGPVLDPRVTVGRDGRIGLVFGVDVMPNDPYFVVHVLLSNGQQDGSAPGGGRISVRVPRQDGLNLAGLRWLSGAPDLRLAGTAAYRDSASRIMLWRANLATGVVGAPEYSPAALGKDFRATGFAPAGNGRLWAFGSEDQYVYGRLGASPLVGYGRGALLGYDTAAFAATEPVRVVAGFVGRNKEAFSEAKQLSNGDLLVLGTYDTDRLQYPLAALKRFTADGRLDMGYAAGTGSVTVDSGVWGIYRLVRSADDNATVLISQTSCSVGGSICHSLSWLKRFTAAGALDSTFGAKGVLEIFNGAIYVPGVPAVYYVPGFAGDQGTVLLARSTLDGKETIYPVRYNNAGTLDASFGGAAQAFSTAAYGSIRKLDTLPDGRLQAVAVNSSFDASRQVKLWSYRWLSNGQIDPAAKPDAPVSITVTGDFPLSAEFDTDTLLLPDGRTLVAINQTNQCIVVRLKADGTLDETFGDAGLVRIDGIHSVAPGPIRLARDLDGGILLTYDSKANNGRASTVARLGADGQPDTGFTADRRFESQFALSGKEQASDLLVLRDGGLLAIGQSDGYGLLLKLRGTAAQAAGSAAAVEFLNRSLGHYFVSAGSVEIANVETGGAGPAWQRTGLGFRAYLPELGVPPGAVPVCRFYGTPGRGPNSHFYTLNTSECAKVKQDPGWTYEGIAFYLYAPVNGQCGAGQQAVYRVYNNRSALNDSNHRYITDPGVYEQMRTLGWSPEGIVFCAPVR